MTDRFHFLVCITGKTIKSNHHRLTERTQITYMLIKITETLLQSLHIGLFNTIKADASMHFQTLCGGNNYSQLWLQSTFTAFDIIKFLRTEVSTEAGFRYNIVAESHGHFRCQNRVTTMCNIGEWTSMNKSSRSFGSLN